MFYMYSPTTNVYKTGYCYTMKNILRHRPFSLQACRAVVIPLLQLELLRGVD